MKYDEDVSPGFAQPLRHAIYNSSIASSASASTASVWSSNSDLSSHTSDSSNTSDDGSSGVSLDGDAYDSYCCPKQTRNDARISQATSVPVELRQNPRRSAPGSNGRPCPPPLVRQSDRKVNFVDSLVDSSTHIVDAIWPTSSTVCRAELGSKAVLPLRTFIQETLRRSRTSYSTLQVALYYLILIKPHVPSRSFLREQSDDRHSTQALQCGRRMFLAALILASKYLQDRNYSARAWSKISGLNTQEINQNEMAFLLAVNWKLHIADDVFQRWSDIVIQYTPPSSPPSPGGNPQAITQAHEDWRHIILGLNVELTNVEGLVRTPRASPQASDLSPMSPRSILNTSYERVDVTSVPKGFNTPMVMEPQPTVFTPGRLAPSMGMLPTPRLTPQMTGLCTPAAGVTPSSFGKGSSMSLAVAQASHCHAAQQLDRPPTSMSFSPQNYFGRRSSLANSVSTASSPESMVSDSSRSSRSSSISSASSLASASVHAKTSVPARFRPAKLCHEKLSSRSTIPSVPEDIDDQYYGSSPESYTGPVGRLGDWTMGENMVSRKRSLEDMVSDPASDAARALQELREFRGNDATPIPRRHSNTLQDNVRDLLHASSRGHSWPDTFVRSRASESDLQASHVPEFSSRKRVCCATEAMSGYQHASNLPPMAQRGPGMWANILN